MVKHLTVRMAWHDNGWNGKICDKPDENASCAAPRSLLPERIARRKDLEFEKEHAGEKIDKYLSDYLPPCFWSANAFSPETAEVVFKHPFSDSSAWSDSSAYSEIPKHLPEYSIYTWPFRLPFTHSKKNKKKHGRYHPNLKKRVNHFFEKFELGESLIFFYLHRDNPISADERKYALVGCAKLSEIGKLTEYSIDEAELEKIRDGEGMKHFVPVNWARRVSYDFEESGILLPYHEYLDHVEDNPEERNKLDEMRVLVDENELVPRFKYVAEEMNDDQCLYLLYKLRKAIEKIQKHHIVEDFEREKELVERYIQEIWERRGLYPGLGNVLSLLANPDSEDASDGNKIIEKVKENFPENRNLLEYTFKLLENSKNLPSYLQEFEGAIRKIRRRTSDYEPFIDFLKKMSLFSLTKFQMMRILFPDQKSYGVHPFGGKENVEPQNIQSNPYLLCEEYIPLTEDEEKEKAERDRLDIRERPISLFSIDIGMFPDEDYIDRNDDLQDMGPVSPKRLRALIINRLKQIGNQGDCYASLDAIYERIREHPLFYKKIKNEELLIRKSQLKTDRCREHFLDRLRLVDKDDEVFFYLEEVKGAEEIIEKVVESLVNKKDHEVDVSWIDDHIEQEKQELEGIEGFDRDQFERERKDAYRGALRKSFYLITGKPGSGKTYILREIVKRIDQNLGENLTLLAPTGKATLRMKEETEFEGAQTIDKFVYRHGFSDCLKNFENIIKIQEKGKYPEIENLIIDEASMVDLQRLSILFNMLDCRGLRNVKRVILVGDDNQLPPIGFGCPFHDIVENFKRDKERRENHFVDLRTNCRQKYDSKILRASEVFRGKNRYYSEIFEELKSGGEVSEWLNVDYWENNEELKNFLRDWLDELVDREVDSTDGGREEKLNEVFGLHQEGFVPGNSPENLSLDGFQIITPYRASFYGTMGLNEYVRDEYKDHKWQAKDGRSCFFHSDKIIRTSNWYQWNQKLGRRELALSNGSIGVICDHGYGKKRRRGYFPDYSPNYRYFTWSRIDDEENFELAYAITIHKSQGSDFDNTFVVIPRRRGLLTRELIYTALTRSKGPLNLFIQVPKKEEDNPLDIARSRSSLLRRNTSLFSEPMKSFRVLYPDSDDRVRSRVEYILYRALKEEEEKRRLQFFYEEDLVLGTDEGNIKIRPDFTVETDNRVYYWEHLGLLDQRDYYEDWKERRRLYRKNDLEKNLVTTDDLNGIHHERIKGVIEDILQNNLIKTEGNRFSNHHYQLYGG